MNRLLFCFLLASTSLCAQIPFVSIDTLTWSVENLRVTTFRNGDEIFNARTREEWIECLTNGIPAYCDYRNDTTLGKRYGHLYNWFAIADPRGLAPLGARVANNRDWSSLYLTVNEDVFNWQNMGLFSKRLRSTVGWNNAQAGENRYDFNILPGGFRNQNGEFSGMGMETAIWVRDTMSYGVVSQGNALMSPYALVSGLKADVLFTNDGKKSGCYVRLVYGDEFGINSNIPKNNQEFMEEPYNPDQEDEDTDEQKSNKKGRKRD